MKVAPLPIYQYIWVNHGRRADDVARAGGVR